MSEEIKFTKEQIDYAKHCLEHFEVLTGGRGHSKTKQIIEQLQQENQQLKEDYQVLRATNISLNDLVNSCQQKIRDYKSVLNEVREYITKDCPWYKDAGVCGTTILRILDKVGVSNE